MIKRSDPDIAIIGAGVSGILTAIQLQKRGYTNITLYEKSDRIASLTHTFRHDNYNFDFSTKLIPAIGLTHDGIYPPLQALIRDAGVTLSTPPVPRFYDFEGLKFMDLPVNMQGFKKTRIISDFAKAYNLLEQISRCSSLAEINKAGLIQPGENVDAWAARHDIQAFGTFTNYLVDLFNIGPCHLAPADFVLVSRVHFIAPYLHAILSKNGVRHYFKLFKGSRSDQFRTFLEFEKKDTKYYLVKEGYAEFFRRLVAHYDLTVKCNSHLAELTKTAKGLDFVVNGHEKVTYDKVIFCCPPPAIAAISYNGEIKKLLGNIRSSHTVRTWAFEADGWNDQSFGDTGYVIDGANRLGMGSTDFKPNGELMYITRESPASKLMVCAVYLDHNTPEQEKQPLLERSLKDFNMTLTKVVSHRDFAWPHHASLAQNRDNWNERIEALQGKDGIYYLGECLSGIGVPTILEHSIKFTETYFS